MLANEFSKELIRFMACKGRLSFLICIIEGAPLGEQDL